MLHLKRFCKKGGGLGSAKGKLSTDVKFACKELDLTPYAAEGSPDSGGAVYDLYGELCGVCVFVHKRFGKV